MFISFAFLKTLLHLFDPYKSSMFKDLIICLYCAVFSSFSSIFVLSSLPFLCILVFLKIAFFKLFFVHKLLKDCYSHQAGQRSGRTVAFVLQVLVSFELLS